MARPSKKRKNQLIKVRQAQEGAKRRRARIQAEKARQEAEPSQYLAEDGGSAGVPNQPRGSELEDTLEPNGFVDQAPAANEALVQEAGIPLGRLRPRRRGVRSSITGQ
ncbi:hypothetical protein OPQ81_009324 [Rhizoctonia solani]|nr:hypothetical protein OPQ81_009324 [Rhizoctonia solani]